MNTDFEQDMDLKSVNLNWVDFTTSLK